ncbi:hypothetical protein FGB62_457g013 [Gracilaria domingensis]|nr:hypothetical protein FGB62_457g013 [Gracilaria domingensis]
MVTPRTLTRKPWLYSATRGVTCPRRIKPLTASWHAPAVRYLPFGPHTGGAPHHQFDRSDWADWTRNRYAQCQRAQVRDEGPSDRQKGSFTSVNCGAHAQQTRCISRHLRHLRAHRRHISSASPSQHAQPRATFVSPHALLPPRRKRRAASRFTSSPSILAGARAAARLPPPRASRECVLAAWDSDPDAAADDADELEPCGQGDASASSAGSPPRHGFPCPTWTRIAGEYGSRRDTTWQQDESRGRLFLLQYAALSAGADELNDPWPYHLQRTQTCAGLRDEAICRCGLCGIPSCSMRASWRSAPGP